MDSKKYQVGSIVRLTTDDPVNDHSAGDVYSIAGPCNDNVAWTVLTDEDAVDVECEVLAQYEPPHPMDESEIAAYILGAAQHDEDLRL